MARDHLGSDYSENMSDTTTYSCKTISVEKCSYNEDCCTNMCLYSTESSTATCVSKIENLSDYLVELPEPRTSSIFNLKASCHKNSDCNRLERCMLFADKSRSVCIKLPSPKQTTPKQIGPEEQTTLFNPQQLQSCVIPGLHCKKDDDCCSKKCHNYLNTGMTYCLNTIERSPVLTVNSYDQTIASTRNKALQCISTGLQSSLRSCSEMFHEPFFLHPPGTRPRDGIYINPMSPFISEHQKPKDNESFYLHSPNDLVYTRITRLFCDNVDKTINDERTDIEKKDETLTVKVDVHINNGSYKPISNGNSIKSDIIKDTEHAYEQICIRPDETESVKSVGHKKFNDDASESSRSKLTVRRFSRSSSASESSHLSSEIPCYSSTTSTPSLSRKSSNERIDRTPKPPELPERKIVIPVEVERDSKPQIDNINSIVKPPPPPPPPPPPDSEEIPPCAKIPDLVDKNFKEIKDECNNSSATNKSDTSSSEQPQSPQTEIPAVITLSPQSSSPSSNDSEDTKPNQVSHLVHKHMVLPFIPPKFANAADSDTLLKPSEYLRSICKTSNKNTLSKARSVDNLDIQGRVEVEEVDKCQEQKTSPGPPPPPLPPPIVTKDPGHSVNTPTTSTQESETPKTHQPLATISIQDLTSVQLRRTNIKMNATKNFSTPPPRSVSMTNVSEAFFVQKTDLIAELKKAKDISGIKKFKVEMAKVEKTQEQNLIMEISKSLSVSSFVDQIPERDSSGNLIPIWKRQMLARKAAERAKKELEEQIARENEEKRQKAIPPWKRQLLAKKDSSDEKKPNSINPVPTIVAPPPVKIDVIPPQKKEITIPINRVEKAAETEEKKIVTRQDDSDDDAPIIPWRAQLRKTNSKLNILD